MLYCEAPVGTADCVRFVFEAVARAFYNEDPAVHFCLKVCCSFIAEADAVVERIRGFVGSLELADGFRPQVRFSLIPVKRKQPCLKNLEDLHDLAVCIDAGVLPFESETVDLSMDTAFDVTELVFGNCERQCGACTVCLDEQFELATAGFRATKRGPEVTTVKMDALVAGLKRGRRDKAPKAAPRLKGDPGPLFSHLISL